MEILSKFLSSEISSDSFRKIGRKQFKNFLHGLKKNLQTKKSFDFLRSSSKGFFSEIFSCILLNLFPRNASEIPPRIASARFSQELTSEIPPRNPSGIHPLIPSEVLPKTLQPLPYLFPQEYLQGFLSENPHGFLEKNSKRFPK